MPGSRWWLGIDRLHTQMAGNGFECNCQGPSTTKSSEENRMVSIAKVGKIYPGRHSLNRVGDQKSAHPQTPLKGQEPPECMP